MSPNVSTMLALVTGFALVLAPGPFSAADARGDDRRSDSRHDSGEIRRIEYGVPHTSTVSANLGQQVRLYVREVFAAKSGRHGSGGPKSRAEVVLFAHGGSLPSVPDYDLQFEDYSWAEFLAQAGFDVFMMDQTGYGFSPRPTMNDPCNASPAQQALLVPNPLEAPCPPNHPSGLTTTESDVDEVNTVVDFIRRLRGVDRVHLIGWSGGGPRIGVFAARHPEKVDKLVFYATGAFEAPASPWSMNLQTHQGLFEGRWDAEVGCENQFDPKIRPAIWRTTMSFDLLGSTWGTPDYNPIASPTGGLMRFPSVAYRFTPAQAAQIEAPSLLIVGEFDGALTLTRDLYGLLGTHHKVLIEVACASHFLVWERQHDVLLEASRAWLQRGSIRGLEQGVITVDRHGTYRKR
jgi:pimeloyl-ACP methyl ester carboxylesterase